MERKEQHQNFTYRSKDDSDLALLKAMDWSLHFMKLQKKEEEKKQIFPKRGEIWTADFGENVGSEVNKVRPCIIVQNNIGNEHSPTTIVLPISHKKNSLPTHVALAGETIEGIILGEQVKTISKARLGRFIGSLSGSEMDNIENALKIALGF